MSSNEDESSQWKKFVKITPPSVKHVRVRARKIESATLRHAHRFIISRWTNLRDVRRHAIGWIVLAGLLVVVTGIQLLWIQNAYSTLGPTKGGAYAEGVIGRLDTLNPIYASTQSERSASYLIFSSLFRYDARNNLEGDLATTMKQSDAGRVYTVDLRPEAKWHDGKPVTADDVVFTLGLIKNPQTRSYLYRTWQDVQVKKLTNTSVEFRLPSAYAPFPHALTFGILPKHVLQTISPARLREHTFNRDPVGSGPFVFRNIQVINPDADRVVLQVEKNAEYYRGAVKLDRFQLHTYKTHDDLRGGFLSREINAANELTSKDVETVKQVSPDTTVADAPLYNGVYAFFRNDSPVLSDIAVRRALVKATNTKTLRAALSKYTSPLEGPLLRDQVASISDLKQTAFDAKAAAAELEQAGWVVGKDGIRQKNGQPLLLSVVTPETGDFPAVIDQIAKQWRDVGVDARKQVVQTDTFESKILASRFYDVLIYELALGADPDVFAYWHSSQANIHGYNLANYKSGVADDALVSARGRSEADLRATKYRGFFEQWLSDAPAVALYRPHLRYVMTDNTHSVEQAKPVIDTLGRYHNIDQWTVMQDEQFNTP